MTWTPVHPSLFESKPPPGEFRARCHLGARLPLDELTEAEREGANAEDAQLRAEGTYSNVFMYDRRLKTETALVPCTLDTTDRAEYLAHMERFHGKKPAQIKGKNSGLANQVRRMWKGPSLTGDGRPFTPSTKSVAEAVETCPSCGLVAELRGIGFGMNADELWWRQHLNACAEASAQDGAA